MIRVCCFVLVILVFVSPIVAADEPTPTVKQLRFFETKIRPVLVEHCHRCHSADAKNVRGELLLDTRAGIRKGGESGPAIVPGNVDESLLISALRHESFEMPPDQKLPERIIDDFETWIRMGAADPRDGDVRLATRKIDIEQGRKFWSFQPIRKPEVPSLPDDSWSKSDIDRFILDRLRAADLAPLADADRGTLIRRAYFDLIGLPPTPEQIREFINDKSAGAFDRVVDELLRSPRFGERWGRHWLDVVRFAESSGGGRTLLFPDAWRYRDYVIESFNHDVPYDHFVKQQIAGDLLEATDWQEKRRHIAATAFLVLGPTNYELQDKETLEMDIVDEQLDTMGKAFLGMTLGCARCHDHKFDPIPTRDYYALAGILKSTKSVIHSNVSKWNESELPVSPEKNAELQKHKTDVAALQGELKSLREALQKAGGGAVASSGSKSLDPKSLRGIVVDDIQAEKIGRWTSSQSVGGYVGQSYLFSGAGKSSVTFSPKLPKRDRYEVLVTYTPHGNRSPNAPVRIIHGDGETVVHVNQTKAGSVSHSIQSLGFFEFDPKRNPRVVVSNVGSAGGVVIADAVMFVSRDPKQEPRVAVGADKKEETNSQLRASLTAKIKQVEAAIKESQAATPKRQLAMAVVDMDKVGDIPISIRGLVQNPGEIVPRGMLQVAAVGEIQPIPDKESGRRQVANWIAGQENPLTARVMVNRVWYWLFGEGLVRTVDNFGATGDEPSHPELLDYLAIQFVEDGWSVKELIRQVMSSRTYQLSSEIPQSATLDSQSIDPANRLLRRMNRQRLDAESIRDALLLVGGNLDLTMGGANTAKGTKSEYGYEFKSTRRSVYVPVFRNSLPQIFATFDFADPNIQVGMRTSSTTAPQALLLMNHPMIMQQSEAAAKRLLALSNLTAQGRINHAYSQVLGRAPSDGEALLASRFVGDSQDARRWGLLYQILFQSIDFRYLK